VERDEAGVAADEQLALRAAEARVAAAAPTRGGGGDEDGEVGEHRCVPAAALRVASGCGFGRGGGWEGRWARA